MTGVQKYSVNSGLISNGEFLEYLSQNYMSFDTVQKGNKTVYNIPSGFDIETTSFHDNGQKRSIMYLWGFGIDNHITTGRTWDDFIKLLSHVKSILGLSDKVELIIYVHNLPYEFQFIRKLFHWDSVFLLDDRKPVKCVSEGFVFKCMLKLSGGKSLAMAAKDLTRYKIDKLVGGLDYSLLRHSDTFISSTEYCYMEHDVRVILHYIQEKIENDGNIIRIPLTNTGYVRRFVKGYCFKDWGMYHALMSTLTITTEIYNLMKECFQGGFVHASHKHAFKTISHVSSCDLISSYPSVMVLEKFPMSVFQAVDGNITSDDIIRYMKKYACVIRARIYNIIPRIDSDHIISFSKVRHCTDYTLDNGRIITASYLEITMTEVDYLIYRLYYEWEKIIIDTLLVSEKNYLPKPIVESILKIYKNKTLLKGNLDEIVNYMISKNMLNSAYGMIVTDIVRDILSYQDDEFTKESDSHIEDTIEYYNENPQRFLYYPWGIWVTSYARRNVLNTIAMLGEDYVYSDTDSIKHLNHKEHSHIFEEYNKQIMDKISKSSLHFRISKSEYMPENEKGEKMVIGTWDYEGEYDRFKTIGAKRYMSSQKIYKSFIEDGISIDISYNQYSMTVSGCNKAKGCSYIRFFKDPFEAFSTGLIIPKKYSGRMTFEYIDEHTEGYITDYTGKTLHYSEESSVYMESSDYSISPMTDYVKYVLGHREIEE